MDKENIKYWNQYNVVEMEGKQNRSETFRKIESKTCYFQYQKWTKHSKQPQVINK